MLDKLEQQMRTISFIRSLVIRIELRDMKKATNDIYGLLAAIFSLTMLANLAMTIVFVRYFFMHSGVLETAQGPFALLVLFAVFTFTLVSFFLVRTYWQTYNGLISLKWPAIASSSLVAIEMILLIICLRLVK